MKLSFLYQALCCISSRSTKICRDFNRESSDPFREYFSHQTLLCSPTFPPVRDLGATKNSSFSLLSNNTKILATTKYRTRLQPKMSKQFYCHFFPGHWTRKFHSTIQLVHLELTDWASRFSTLAKLTFIFLFLTKSLACIALSTTWIVHRMSKYNCTVEREKSKEVAS